MAEIRARVDEIVDEIVADPDTAEALKPWFGQLCKRPCFHDQYLDAYNEPNTHLVDTDGKGVAEITETGLVANGQHYDLDCIIYASGFEVGIEHALRAGFDLAGRDGLKLSEKWDDGMTSLHVHGFPNAFIVGPAQGANMISNVAAERFATIRLVPPGIRTTRARSAPERASWARSGTPKGPSPILSSSKNGAPQATSKASPSNSQS
ncbi:MAG: cation diffusion facilitator CzcD-associated flavoprotein CzcO [Candidatus Poriferisodalaceae bacterium]|jgi:cation diffusion facilitator CzcD-associated flavoprotein CzcO